MVVWRWRRGGTGGAALGLLARYAHSCSHSPQTRPHTSIAFSSRFLAAPQAAMATATDAASGFRLLLQRRWRRRRKRDGGGSVNWHVLKQDTDPPPQPPPLSSHTPAHPPRHLLEEGQGPLPLPPPLAGAHRRVVRGRGGGHALCMRESVCVVLCAWVKGRGDGLGVSRRVAAHENDPPHKFTRRRQQEASASTTPPSPSSPSPPAAAGRAATPPRGHRP